ncbi:MAG: lamin tail domain-containing protein [Haloferacaceae archaeon]
MARRATLVAVGVLVVLAGCASVVDTGGDRSTATVTGVPHPSTAPTVRARVTDVIDGDTIRVRYRNGTTDTVRLIGIDSPETRGAVHPDEFEGVPETDAGRRCLRRAGEAAADAARNRLDGARVGLGFDPEEDRRDVYGRLLAYVYVDGDQFNYRSIAAGDARMYDTAFVERARYAAAEDRARASGRGLWTCATPSTVGTGDAAPIVVSVHPDPPGNDNEHLDEEYVTIRNAGNRTLDLSGWTVGDEAGRRYTFPDGTTLAPGASLTLHTGQGTNGGGQYYWGLNGAVWNNDGDTATVRDETGRTVATRRY